MGMGVSSVASEGTTEASHAHAPPELPAMGISPCADHDAVASEQNGWMTNLGFSMAWSLCHSAIREVLPVFLASNNLARVQICRGVFEQTARTHCPPLESYGSIHGIIC